MGFADLYLSEIDTSWIGVFVELFLFLYSFLGLAIVADEYLVLSLEVACVRWGIREDVAGATLMAFGSAAPEILVSSVNTLKATSQRYSTSSSNLQLGTSAIFGSGVIAFSLIPSACSLFSNGQLLLKRRPLLWDICFYCIALTSLGMSLRDHTVTLQESGSLLLLYLVYVCTVVISPVIRKSFRYRVLGRQFLPATSFVLQREALLQTDNSDENSEIDSIDDMRRPSVEIYSSTHPFRAHSLSSVFSEEMSQDESFTGKLVKSASQPLLLLFKWTCPTCTRETSREWLYPLTFIISLSYLGWFSFVISCVVERWGILTGLPATLFGFAVVAIGAEIPDTIQSVTVARKGYGSMAVSNALGSQICNICIGLGLPWTLSTALGKNIEIDDISSLQFAAYLQSANIIVVVSLLFGPVLWFKQKKAVLGRWKGIVMMLSYFVIITTYSVYSINEN